MIKINKDMMLAEFSGGQAQTTFDECILVVTDNMGNESKFKDPKNAIKAIIETAEGQEILLNADGFQGSLIDLMMGDLHEGHLNFQAQMPDGPLIEWDLTFELMDG